MSNQTKPNIYAPPLDVIKFAEALLSDEVRGSKVKAEESTGVDRGKFYYHWKKPEFRQWYIERCSEYLSSNEAMVATTLMKQVRNGDMKAIELYYKLNGRLRDKVEHSLDDGTKRLLEKALTKLDGK